MKALDYLIRQGATISLGSHSTGPEWCRVLVTFAGGRRFFREFTGPQVNRIVDRLREEVAA